MTPLGTMMWTASCAGWCVLGYATGVEGAYLVAVCCGFAAFIWHQLQN